MARRPSWQMIRRLIVLALVAVLFSRIYSNATLEKRLSRLTRLDFASREVMVNRVSEFNAAEIAHLIELATREADDRDKKVRRVARYMIRRTFPMLASTLMADLESSEETVLALTKLESELLTLHREPYTPNQSELLARMGASELAGKVFSPHQCTYDVRPCPQDPLMVLILWDANRRQDAVEMAWRLLDEHQWDGSSRGYGYDGVEQAEAIFQSLFSFVVELDTVDSLRKRAASVIASQPGKTQYGEYGGSHYWMRRILRRCEIHDAFQAMEYTKLCDMMKERNDRDIVDGFVGQAYREQGDEAYRVLLKRIERATAEKKTKTSNWKNQFYLRQLVEAERNTHQGLRVRPGLCDMELLRKITGYIEDVPTADDADAMFPGGTATEANELMRIEYPRLLQALDGGYPELAKYKTMIAERMLAFESRKCMSVLIWKEAELSVHWRLRRMVEPDGNVPHDFSFQDWLDRDEETYDWPDDERWW